MINDSIGIIALMVLGVIILGILIEILVLVHRQDKKIREITKQNHLIESAVTEQEKENRNGKKGIL